MNRFACLHSMFSLLFALSTRAKASTICRTNTLSSKDIYKNSVYRTSLGKLCFCFTSYSSLCALLFQWEPHKHMLMKMPEKQGQGDNNSIRLHQWSDYTSLNLKSYLIAALKDFACFACASGDPSFSLRLSTLWLIMKRFSQDALII